jgi:hypothetical protein
MPIVTEDDQQHVVAPAPVWAVGECPPCSWLTRPPVTAGSRSAFPCLFRSGGEAELMARDGERWW